MLAGGGALIRGINDLVTQKQDFYPYCRGTFIMCCNGCGEILDDFRKLKRIVDTVDPGTNSIRT